MTGALTVLLRISELHPPDEQKLSSKACSRGVGRARQGRKTGRYCEMVRHFSGVRVEPRRNARGFWRKHSGMAAMVRPRAERRWSYS